MVKIRKQALARHNFLLSLLQPVLLPNRRATRWVLPQTLPRAPTLRKSIDQLMAERGVLCHPADCFEEVSEAEAHYVKAFLECFIPVNPGYAVDADAEAWTTTYEFGLKREFASEVSARDAIQNQLRYEAPTPVYRLANWICREDLFYHFHVALRKYCDSPASSAMWNLWHLMDDADRAWLMDLIWAQLQQPMPETYEALVSSVKKALLDDSSFIGKAGRASVHCLFRTFSEDDWGGFCSVLVNFDDQKAA